MTQVYHILGDIPCLGESFFRGRGQTPSARAYLLWCQLEANCIVNDFKDNPEGRSTFPARAHGRVERNVVDWMPTRRAMSVAKRVEAVHTDSVSFSRMLSIVESSAPHQTDRHDLDLARRHPLNHNTRGSTPLPPMFYPHQPTPSRRCESPHLRMW
jgi:hypothetical protein